jgi:hypothetical protein
LCEREGGRKKVCVSERERDKGERNRVNVRVRVWREGEWNREKKLCVHVCEREREEQRERVCVREKERSRERESVCKRKRGLSEIKSRRNLF